MIRLWPGWIELWIDKTPYFHVGIDNNCPNGCIIFDFGWFGFTVLYGDCIIK